MTSELDNLINEKMTIPQIIYSFLYEGGASKTKDIFNFVFKHRNTVTKDSINVTMWNNQHIFEHKSYGMWDLKENSKKNRKKIAYYKAVILYKHYKQVLQEKYKANGDTRLAGVDFTEEEQEYIEKLTEKYKKD